MTDNPYRFNPFRRVVNVNFGAGPPTKFKFIAATNPTGTSYTSGYFFQSGGTGEGSGPISEVAPGVFLYGDYTADPDDPTYFREVFDETATYLFDGASTHWNGSYVSIVSITFVGIDLSTGVWRLTIPGMGTLDTTNPAWDGSNTWVFGSDPGLSPLVASTEYDGTIEQLT